MEEEEENQSTTTRTPPSSSTMDKETTVLSNLAANHLFLTQFEAFRATIFTLRRNNPDLALSLLQTIVVHGGNLGPNLLFSPNCPSPALLTWLSSIELFQFDNPTSIWSNSVSLELIRVRVEFLLYVQMAITRVWDWIKRSLVEIGVVFEDIETGFEENIVGFENEAELREFKDGIRVLDGVMEVGLRRLKDDLIVSMEGIDNGDEIVVKDADFAVLRKVILMNADIFDAICDNVDRQVGTESGGVDGGGESGSGSGLAITVTTQGRSGRVSSEDDHEVLKSLQKYVQEVHLEEIKECVKNEDVDGAISHIRYLHLGYGVAEDEYRMVFLDFLKKVLSGKDELVDAWQPTRDKLLYIYQEALSSACSHLVQILQAVQDQLLVEEMKMFSSSDNQILPPLKHLQYQMQKKRLGDTNDDNSFSLNTMISACMRDMYHYTRVAGLHFFECIMDTALSAVKNELLEEASSVVLLFPRLQPLVGVMGWDLLANKTAARRKLMQLLWTSKSKLYRLEESYLYENESDEVSCVEYLCDTLCYRLDLASFVACVNSGQPWDIMCSLSLSGHGYEDFQARTTHLDPFVENFILERLSLQSPLRVLFDVVPTIKFEDAIRLISMQPTNSPTGEWKRMQDAELIHMRYALDCAVMALATMEKSRNDPQRYYPQLALNFLKNLKSHLEAVTDLSRKIFLVNIIISLLHVDSITVDFEHCGLEGSIYELSQTSLQQNDDFEEDGNKMVVSFVESLLDMLSCNLPSKQAWEATDVNQEKQALEWRISNARSFIDDWQWRLSVLQKLLPLPELKWGWKEALAVLRAAPSKLLNLRFSRGACCCYRFKLTGGLCNQGVIFTYQCHFLH
ncbi:uncharacterized protein LOC141595977 [Silene latifolia]|uniref:uncharacterized protein LOC141595977 n=1 Tax=Silene latifolia TaxID=37657 RepID=UPI003D777528